MSRIVHVETKDGITTVTQEINTDPASYVPPPEGWQRAGCLMVGHDACIVEDLLVRGFPESASPGVMFSLNPEISRQSLSHEQDITEVLARCREHGIAIDVGEVFDEADCVRMDQPFRVFRGWRMIGQGCPWASPAQEYSTFVGEDSVVRCSVCGQEPKAG